ncbi:MAG: transcriptional regulator [Bacteroidales bacterium]|jgi:predicted transcriptional regulator|nr:transcriptional regulator [Bacteroidales bacterium]
MVTVHQINRLVNGIILNGTAPDQDFSHAFASDLMSDVLTIDKEGMILLTGLSTLQTIRTAEMSNVYCVVVARGKRVTNEMLKLAKEHSIAVISCSSSMFAASGRLYENGIKPVY